VCHLVVLHTTAALTTADLDPGTDADMLDAFERIVPKLNYRHPHDPDHVPDHILSALIGTSVGLLVENGSLILGTWQRVILVELDGPRQREIAVGFVPTIQESRPVRSL
jgi:secondary thiamine-phosphate synthase enzyme